VDGGGKLAPFGPGGGGGAAAGEGGFGFDLHPAPGEEAVGLGDGF